MRSSSEPGVKARIIIPNWNGMRWLDGCLNALQKQTMGAFTVIVVVSGPIDPRAPSVSQLASSLTSRARLPAAIVGYEQRQTTAKEESSMPLTDSPERYAGNAVRFGPNVAFPELKLNQGMKFVKKFANRSTFQTLSVQLSGAIGF